MNDKNIYELWSDLNIFEKSIKKNQHLKEYKFMEGPPFYTGEPHYGHICGAFIKDTILRHKHNLGYNVPRVSGADCSGLPIEYEIEKLLNIKSTDEIEDFGIGNYNEECRKIVLRCEESWIDMMNKLGRWIDFKNGYKTMTKEYMNSVWWVLKTLYDKGDVYEGIKVMPYSTSCATSLSNFETQQNYQMIDVDSIYLKFKIPSLDAYILVWTTTPWTLPSNYCLCVNSKINYSLIISENIKYILCSNLISKVIKKTYEILDSFEGSSLVGINYEPLYNYNTIKEYKIISDDFVKELSGTGIVHIAPGHGEDDYSVCIKNNIINKESKIFEFLNKNGYVTDIIPECNGIFYKEFDSWIISDLKNRNLFYSKLNIKHQVPFCWRSDTPLIYKTVSSWFVKVYPELMIEKNKEINWRQTNVGDGRFNNWLENARDWAISRSRYWGCTIPIWKSDDGDIICIGSSYELEELSGLPKNSIVDLHRHHIDHILIKKNGKIYKRIDSVMDCWFESGAVPYASLSGIGIAELLNLSEKGIEYKDGYFIETKNPINVCGILKTIHKITPADFIAEGLDQTRGWFYTLLVLSTNLFNMVPFKNVIVNGLIMSEDGKKMSKRLKNYPDPSDILQEYGSDALRLYLLSSQISRTESLKFNSLGVKNMKKDILIPLSNLINFYKEHSKNYNLMHENLEKIIDFKFGINIWVIKEYENIRDKYEKYLEEYNIKLASGELFKLVSLLNGGYVKLGRNMLKGKNGIEEWSESLFVLKYIIKSIIIDFRSIIPFFCEYQYINFIDEEFNEESVHLIDKIYQINLKLNEKQKILYEIFKNTYDILEGINFMRGNLGISAKKQLNYMGIIKNADFDLSYIYSESNILEIEILNIEVQKIIIPIKGLFFKKYGKSISEVFNEYTLMNQNEININCNYKGFEINEDMFNISYKINDEKYTSHEIVKIKNFVLIIDKNHSEKHYYYRKIASGIQKARKNEGYHVWDKIEVHWNSCKLCTEYDLENLESKKYIENIIGVEFKRNETLKNIHKIEDLNISLVKL